MNDRGRCWRRNLDKTDALLVQSNQDWISYPCVYVCDNDFHYMRAPWTRLSGPPRLLGPLKVSAPHPPLTAPLVPVKQKSEKLDYSVLSCTSRGINVLLQLVFNPTLRQHLFPWSSLSHFSLGHSEIQDFRPVSGGLP